MQVAEHHPHPVSLLPPIGLCDGDIWVQNVKSPGRTTLITAATQGPAEPVLCWMVIVPCVLTRRLETKEGRKGMKGKWACFSISQL